MDRQEVMNFIDNSKKFGSKLELDRIKRLCELLGNPEKDLKCIHIAGTNGKGSTSAFIHNILVDAGYRTGLYTSPFIYDFNERIQINNTSISDSELTEIMSVIAQKTDIMVDKGFEHPTEFELITAAAFLYFKNQCCDYVVLEVGLGGIFDATNVIDEPVLSVITSISLDHTDYLGNTITQVAENKCGIIKKNRPILTYALQDKAALSVIAHHAQLSSSALIVPDISSLKISACDLSGNEFSYKDEQYRTSLIGKYQIYNSITAISAAELLKSEGVKITPKNIKNGLQYTKWPARFEILRNSPTFIVDGSHNADGMNAFVETIKEINNGKKIICIFGMLKDKDYDYCLKRLSEVTDTVVVTEVDSPRKETADKLSETAKKYIKTVYTEQQNTNAVKKALSIATDDDIIVAVGSLYMMVNIKNSLD